MQRKATRVPGIRRQGESELFFKGKGALQGTLDCLAINWVLGRSDAKLRRDGQDSKRRSRVDSVEELGVSEAPTNLEHLLFRGLPVATHAALLHLQAVALAAMQVADTQQRLAT